VQIEQEKIDYVPVKQAIGQITQNPSKQQCKREIAPRIGLSPSHEQNRHNDERDNGNHDEESIVALERSKGRAGVGDVNQTEEIGDNNACLIRVDQTQDQLLAPLIKSIEREREKKNELHLGDLSQSARRKTDDAVVSAVLSGFGVAVLGNLRSGQCTLQRKGSKRIIEL
jgi:hypothetical protein